MADRRQLEALYQSIARDLQKIKGELMNEVKYAAAQTGAMVNQANSEKSGATAALAQEIRYGYKQNQNVYDGIAAMVKNDVSARLNSVDQKLADLEKLQTLLNELSEVKYSCLQLQAAYEGLAALVSNDVLPKLEKSAEDLQVHNAQVLDALSNMADPVDYTRIVDEVGDKVVELLGDVKPEPVVIDYDRIVDSTVEKVVESLPYPEKLDINALADVVAAKVVVPEIDYDRLAEMVAEKMSAKEQTYDVVVDEDGISQISEKVAERLATDAIDYDRIAAIVEDKLFVEEGEEEETSYELVLDEEGISAIAKCVAEELRSTCCVCEPVEEAPVEEAVEEPVEETPVEETVEEPVEEAPVEEAPVEETVEEAPAQEELAVAVAPSYEEIEDGQLVDAETGLVIRLKKSFTAKMKQSDEKVKEYYSSLKNELTSYKKINSNVSWHGDRFNFGRDTVAKINICGKTLGLYLALDPEDPEFKTTVYHQKNVGNQKAYENTPFMVKVKSDAAVKKATRLIVSLAEKLGTEKEANFESVDYVAEYAYETTKQLFEDGYIKATKEKKVDLNF